MMLIASRGMPLDSSLSAPRLSNSTLSGDPVVHERGDEPVRQREHRHEHRHDERNAERGQRRRHRALRHAPDVVDERDLHSTLRSACTTGSLAACQAGKIPLAMVSSSATDPPTPRAYRA